MFVQASVKAPLQQYRMHMGSYPSTEEGLNALLDAPGGDKARHWKGPYIDTLPEDPWKNRYQYRFPGQHNPRGYDIWSMGPDGRPSDDDIGNW
jgi:general secretion pathway protein G